MMTYFAIVTRWLEEIALADIQQQFPSIRIISHAYKRIVFEYDGNAEDLLTLKSIDDVFFFLESFPVWKHRSSLADIEHHVIGAKFWSILPAIAQMRSIVDPSFSVSVSNVWDKNYTPKEIKENVVAWVSGALGWHEKEDGTQTMNIRIFIEKEECLLGVRVGLSPLHRRSYKQETLPGSLKAPIAYCMLKIANINKWDVVVDPLCGVGTIAFESTAFTSHIIAGDISPEALEIAKKSNHTDADIAFCEWDARHMWLEALSVDHIVSNLPFGKQIEVEDETTFFTALLQECVRVLQKNGNIVFLTMHGELITKLSGELGLQVVSQREISLFGVNPLIIALQQRD